MVGPYAIGGWLVADAWLSNASQSLCSLRLFVGFAFCVFGLFSLAGVWLAMSVILTLAIPGRFWTFLKDRHTFGLMVKVSDFELTLPWVRISSSFVFLVVRASFTVGIGISLFGWISKAILEKYESDFALLMTKDVHYLALYVKVVSKVVCIVAHCR